eukprot:Pgem_evm2s12621
MYSYYTFDSNKSLTDKGVDCVIIFRTDKLEIRELMTSISVKIRFIGSEGIWNVWNVFARNFNTKKDVPLSSNAQALDWKWSDLDGNITFKYVDNAFMNEYGEIRLNYVTTGPVGTFGLSALDFVEVMVHVNEPREPRPALPAPPANQPEVVPPSTLPWTHTARLCGLSINPTYTQIQMQGLVNQLKDQFCSVIEVDSGLSLYQTDSMFQNQITFLNSLSTYAESVGLKTVIYQPTLETNVVGGCNAQGNPTAISMAVNKPTWLQKNLAGDLNFFCGTQEVWVENGMESAWFDPNNPAYRTHFLSRVTALARDTKLNGFWGDVPIYSDTFGSWSGGSQYAKQKFIAWASANGLGHSSLPTVADANLKTDIFKAWIQWRHYTMDDWQESILLAGEAGNANFILAAEIYSVDYLDGYWIGLDGGYKKNARQFRVWEIDSVSNTGAMNYATIEDFRNKIAMNKYATAADNGQHSWLFAYGNKPLDGGLVMGAISCIGGSPFDSKTPQMTETVGNAYRTRWYEWINKMSSVIYDYTRIYKVGVFYSTPTRDYVDAATGVEY